MFVSIPFPPPDDEDFSEPPRPIEWLRRFALRAHLESLARALRAIATD